MESFQLYILLVETKLGGPLEAHVPRHLSGMDTVRALWPLNAVLLPRLVAIRSLAYDENFEPEVDAAIEAAVRFGTWPPAWDGLTDSAWRVMLERYLQGLRAALNNEKSGNAVMALPDKLTGSDVTLAVMTFVMHGMKLLWPAIDRSTCELPAGGEPENLLLH